MAIETSPMNERVGPANTAVDGFQCEVENSVLNDGKMLPSSNESLVGGSGDGNDPSLASLEQVFVSESPLPVVPPWLPQNADDGENYIGDPLTRGGFAGRPEGWQR